LATLASLEIKAALPSWETVCYTFGAPRVGNTAFAKLSESAVPDAWAVVRLEDPVPRIPKGMYKRAGQRVVLTNNGKMAV